MNCMYIKHLNIEYKKHSKLKKKECFYNWEKLKGISRQHLKTRNQEEKG